MGQALAVARATSNVTGKPVAYIRINSDHISPSDPLGGPSNRIALLENELMGSLVWLREHPHTCAFRCRFIDHTNQVHEEFYRLVNENVLRAFGVYLV
jgi:hypothetical protein